MNRKLNIITIIACSLLLTACSLGSIRPATISIAKTDNGKISARVISNDTVKITVEPDEGYSFWEPSLSVYKYEEDIIFDYFHTNEKIDYEKSDENTYTFTFMVNATYYISGMFISDQNHISKSPSENDKTYSITEGGSNYYHTLKCNSEAKAGEKVYFKIDPTYSGYYVDDNYPQVKAEDGTLCTVQSEPMNKKREFVYSFIMPAQNVTIEVVVTNSSIKEFNITVLPVTNGKLSTDKSKGSCSSKVTINVTPDSGYRLKENSLIIYNGQYSAGYNTDYSATPEEYYFYMPPCNVNVYAEFEKIE